MKLQRRRNAASRAWKPNVGSQVPVSERAAPVSLLSRCWCEGKLVSVPTVDVRAGLTMPCDRKWCQREDRQQRRSKR